MRIPHIALMTNEHTFFFFFDQMIAHKYLLMLFWWHLNFHRHSNESQLDNAIHERNIKKKKNKAHSCSTLSSDWHYWTLILSHWVFHLESNVSLVHSYQFYNWTFLEGKIGFSRKINLWCSIQLCWHLKLDLKKKRKVHTQKMILTRNNTL